MSWCERVPYLSIISNVYGISLLELKMYVVSTRLALYEIHATKSYLGREERTRLLSFR